MNRPSFLPEGTHRSITEATVLRGFAANIRRAAHLGTAAADARAPDHAGIEGMLMLWNAESDRERSRAMALEMADRNRVNARSTK